MKIKDGDKVVMTQGRAMTDQQIAAFLLRKLASVEVPLLEAGKARQAEEWLRGIARSGK